MTLLILFRKSSINFREIRLFKCNKMLERKKVKLKSEKYISIVHNPYRFSKIKVSQDS